MTSNRRKLILIAEDDPSVRNLLKRALAPLYDVEALENGLSAANRLDEAPTPDLLICDIMMPGLDGLTVARKAKQSPLVRQVPIIFLTAKTMPMDVIQGIQAGARHYVTKPFKLDDLMQKVKKALGH